MRSESYKSRFKEGRRKKKNLSKVFMLLFRRPYLQPWEDVSLLSDETKITRAETLSFEKQGWKSS